MSPASCVSRVASVPHPPAALDAHRRAVIHGLTRPVPWIYWADLLGSAAVGWTAFACAVGSVSDVGVLPGIALFAAALALYRAAMFLHEISHLRSGVLPGFTAVWNLLVGFPLLVPSFLYLGIHKFHHKADTYGTACDPEYVPLAGVRTAILVSTLVTLLLPAFLAVRFLVAAPIAFLVPRWHRWLDTHASAFALNVQFTREVTSAERREIRLVELALLTFWGLALGATLMDWLPWHAFALWYAVAALACMLNHLRTLAAHGYENHAGTPMTRDEQLNDSIDTPGGLWTELWAPIGLRYHALHHYFPGVPYHNLPTVYRRLLAALPADDPYRRTISPGLWASLRRLWSARKEAV
jgi:fatty acid desaturase